MDAKKLYDFLGVKEPFVEWVHQGLRAMEGELDKMVYSATSTTTGNAR